MKCASCDTCKCSEPCVAKVPIFALLKREDQERISALIRHKAYKKGDILLAEGDAPDSLFIINGGSAKAYGFTPDGREQLVYIFSEGDYFGEQFLLGTNKATYHVEALEPLKACLLYKNDFRQILLDSPEIAVKIIEALDDRLAVFEKSFQTMGVRSIDSRLAGLLLQFAKTYGSGDLSELRISLPLSREGMANYLGVARETLSRKLRQFEDDGLIRSDGNKTIVLLDTNALENLSGY